MAPPLAAAVLLNHSFIVPTPETYEALRRAVDPPADHRFGQSVLRLGPGKTATWSFAGR